LTQGHLNLNTSPPHELLQCNLLLSNFRSALEGQYPLAAKDGDRHLGGHPPE